MDFSGISKIGSNILAAFLVLGGIVLAIVGLYMTSYIGTISLGAVFYTVENGSLPITDGANSTLSTLESGYNSAIVSVNSGTLFATSLISVAVILIIFGGFLMVKGKGKKSKKVNY